MGKNPLAPVLAAMNRFSGSPLVHRLGLHGPAQAVARLAARHTMGAGAAVGRRFRAARTLLRPARPAAAAARGDLFDLHPSEEQQLVRDTAQRFAREVLRPAAAAADAAGAAPPEVLARIGELGLALLAVPEALGGAATEASVVTGVLAAEDLAHGDAGLALAALAPVGVAHALSRWGSAEQQATYLAPFASDEAAPAAAVALAEPTPLFDPSALRTRAVRARDGYRLTGDKTLVPLATSAELLLVAATLEDRGPRLFLVERGTPGVETTADPALGLRAAGLGRVTLRVARLARGALLGGEADGGAEAAAALVDLSRVALGALCVGVAQAALDHVIPYCNERIAFGEPISHRQAVAFAIADLAIEIESMRLLVWRAACRAEQGLPFHREAYLARVQCVEKCPAVASAGVQLLGGHGYIKDHPVERFYRDLMTLTVLEGGVLF